MQSTRYVGVTRPLKTPEQVDGYTYPFAFDSDMPEHLHTSYRLIETSDPEALTTAGLQQMFAASRHGRLMAEFEKIEGFELSWITLHPDPRPSDGQGQGGGGGHGQTGGGSRRGKFGKGPDLEMPKERTVPRDPPPPERGAPEPEMAPPEPPGMGMSF